MIWWYCSSNAVTEVVQLLVDNGGSHNLKNCCNIQLKYICNVVTEVVLLLVDNGEDHNLKCR